MENNIHYANTIQHLWSSYYVSESVLKVLTELYVSFKKNYHPKVSVTNPQLIEGKMSLSHFSLDG